MRKALFKYAFVLSDCFLAFALLTGFIGAIWKAANGLNLDLPQILLVFAFLLLSLATITSAYAVGKDKYWQAPLRTRIYLIASIGMIGVFASEGRQVADEMGSVVATLSFLIANLIGYRLWLRYR